MKQAFTFPLRAMSEMAKLYRDTQVRGSLQLEKEKQVNSRRLALQELRNEVGRATEDLNHRKAMFDSHAAQLHESKCIQDAKWGERNEIVAQQEERLQEAQQQAKSANERREAMMEEIDVLQAQRNQLLQERERIPAADAQIAALEKKLEEDDFETAQLEKMVAHEESSSNTRVAQFNGKTRGQFHVQPPASATNGYDESMMLVE